MQHTPRRARLRPGPLLFITLAWIALTTTSLRAHDPGLSALDVSVNMGYGSISVSLSLAASDVALIATGTEAEVRRKLSELASGSVRLSLDGEPLPAVASEVSISDGGGRIRWSSAIPHAVDRARRLTITSDVPKRMSRGHRE